ARVGGYYHDIGKLENPEYFIENQIGEESKHTLLKPNISCSIIKSHIKYGIDVGLKLKLPEEIIHIMREHHGTTMIHYFYKKSLMDKETEKMSKEDLIAIYRHDGPLPSSKESAIIMLADAVEAATRSIKKPSFSRIETIIREIMNARFLDGQLNDCPLTLKDLERITDSFIQFLSAMYHTRIEYPDKDEIKKLENEY
ncbi:MAG: HDIG domain-containing protein, partial [bacterium]|nr:HDIG domain-containing protein [bacterium]